MLKSLFVLLFICGITLCAAQKNELYADCDSKNVKCLGGEDGCVGKKSCSYFVRVEKLKSGKFKFSTYDTTGSVDGYIGVALSFDKIMGGDSLVECVHGNSQGIFASWIPGGLPTRKAPTRLESNDDSTKISDQKVSITDKVRYCEFTREASTKVNGKSFDLNSGNLYVLLAVGKTESGKLAYHGEKTRCVSNEMFKF